MTKKKGRWITCAICGNQQFEYVENEPRDPRAAKALETFKRIKLKRAKRDDP